MPHHEADNEMKPRRNIRRGFDLSSFECLPGWQEVRGLELVALLHEDGGAEGGRTEGDDGEGVHALVTGLGNGLARGLLCSGLLGGDSSDSVGVRDVLAEATGLARAGIVQVGIMCGLNKRAVAALRRQKLSPGGTMKPIAYIRTDLPQKFGIPRNSFLAPDLQGRIVFEPEFALPAAVAGLEGFSHLWLLWTFENGLPGGGAEDVAADSTGAAAPGVVAANPKWSPTVRPPRLGGSERMGIFATRSPFRPNPIGLTCVKLDHVEIGDEGPVVHVLGADLRDRTPIYDIKPYIPFADCHPDATGGWIEDAPWQELDVDFPAALRTRVPAQKLAGLIEVLRQDPRRAGSKHDPERVYHLAYAGLDVAFCVDGVKLSVVGVEVGE